MNTSGVSAGPSKLLTVGTSPDEDAGEIFKVAAFGQPQTLWLPTVPAFRFEYSGSAKLSRVALQLRMVKGESIEISKWRLFLGSSLSRSLREIRKTICCSISVIS